MRPSAGRWLPRAGLMLVLVLVMAALLGPMTVEVARAQTPGPTATPRPPATATPPPARPRPPAPCPPGQRTCTPEEPDIPFEPPGFGGVDVLMGRATNDAVENLVRQGLLSPLAAEARRMQDLGTLFTRTPIPRRTRPPTGPCSGRRSPLGARPGPDRPERPPPPRPGLRPAPPGEPALQRPGGAGPGGQLRLVGHAAGPPQRRLRRLRRQPGPPGPVVRRRDQLGLFGALVGLATILCFCWLVLSLLVRRVWLNALWVIGPFAIVLGAAPQTRLLSAWWGRQFVTTVFAHSLQMWALGLAATSTNLLGALALLWLAIRIPAVLAYAVDGLHGSPVLLLLTSVTLTLGKARRTVRSTARATVADPGRRPGPDHRLVSRTLAPGLVTWRRWARLPAGAQPTARGDPVLPARPLGAGERAILDERAGRRSFLVATPDWLVDHDRRLVVPRPTDVPRHLTRAVGATWWTATREAMTRLAGPLQGYRTVWQARPAAADEPVALLAYPAHVAPRQGRDGRWGFVQLPEGSPDASINEAAGPRQGWGVRLAEPFDRLTRDGRLLQVQGWDRVQARAGAQARFAPDYVRLALYQLQPGDQLERGPHGEIAHIRAVDQPRRDDSGRPAVRRGHAGGHAPGRDGGAPRGRHHGHPRRGFARPPGRAPGAVRPGRPGGDHRAAGDGAAGPGHPLRAGAPAAHRRDAGAPGHADDGRAVGLPRSDRPGRRRGVGFIVGVLTSSPPGSHRRGAGRFPTGSAARAGHRDGGPPCFDRCCAGSSAPSTPARIGKGRPPGRGPGLPEVPLGGARLTGSLNRPSGPRAGSAHPLPCSGRTAPTPPAAARQFLPRPHQQRRLQARSGSTPRQPQPRVPAPQVAHEPVSAAHHLRRPLRLEPPHRLAAAPSGAGDRARCAAAPACRSRAPPPAAPRQGRRVAGAPVRRHPPRRHAGAASARRKNAAASSAARWALT